MAEVLSRSSYLSRNVGDFPAEMVINGKRYVKIDDLRYGTNPHQPAASYRPADEDGVISGMEVLKNGKNGLSQTNLEDISGALNIVKFFDRPACGVMKHVNPSGAAVAVPGEDLKSVYIKGRDADARAAFGSVIAFNVEVDAATATQEEIMTLAACALIAIRKRGRTLVAATRYMIMNLIGSGLFLLGIVILYDLTGHLLMENIHESVAALHATGEYHVPLTIVVALITSIIVNFYGEMKKTGDDGEGERAAIEEAGNREAEDE